MKLKTLFSLLLFVAMHAHAENVSLETPALHGKIRVNQGLKLTDWQAVLNCQFEEAGIRKEVLRFPATKLKRISFDEYSLHIKKADLRGRVSGKLLTCAYKLTLIGRSLEQKRNAIGEIYLMGQDAGEMTATELSDLQKMAKTLPEKARDLRLALLPEGGIVAE